MAEDITNIEKEIHDNEGNVIGTETVSLVKANSGYKEDITFNTYEVPEITLDSTEEEEEAATVKARQIAFDGDL